MTREQLLTKLANARASKIDLTWAQFTAAVGGLDAQQKAVFLRLANKGDESSAMKLAGLLSRVVQAKTLDIARAEVDAIAADDTYTTDDLLSLFP